MAEDYFFLLFTGNSFWDKWNFLQSSVGSATFHIQNF